MFCRKEITRNRVSACEVEAGGGRASSGLDRDGEKYVSLSVIQEHVMLAVVEYASSGKNNLS